ncbi:MAG: site-specific integrase [Nitrosarchaeum sp.]|nr:site-specific integrase [Nitrosarchaeum sp.]
MSLKVLDKSLDDYLSSIFILSHSHSTVSTYRLAITNKHKTGFREFLFQKYAIDEFELVEKVTDGSFDIYKILNEFVVFLDSHGYKPKSIMTRMASVKGYLRNLGLRFNSEDYKQMVRIPKVIRQRDEPVTKELISKLQRNLPPKLQTVILVLSSSGMRLGELVQLELGDIDFTTNPTTIRLRAETTKTRTERETFLTTEATNSLKEYLKRSFEWDETRENFHLKNTKIFGRTSKVVNLKRKSNPKQPQHLHAEALLHNSLRYFLEKTPGLDSRNKNGRKVIHFHALRKYFRTTVGNVCGRDFAEELMGHGFYMDTYYQLSVEKRREMYLQAEPHLTISDFKAVEKDMKVLSTKYQNLENKVDDLMAYLRTNSIEVPEFLR